LLSILQINFLRPKSRSFCNRQPVFPV